MRPRQAAFSIGQVVHHRLFDYRGVVFDIDPTFMRSEEWYAQMARTKPPRDRPWYHVLVHDAEHTTYVAERNLEPAAEAEPIRHPDLDRYFSSFEGGRYLARRPEH